MDSTKICGESIYGKKWWGGRLGSGVGIVETMGMDGKFPEINFTLFHSDFCCPN